MHRHFFSHNCTGHPTETRTSKGQVIQATFSHNLSRNIVALQVEKGASDIFSLINSQSWVSTFSTSTTSAMLTSCPNRICPRSSARLLTIFPAFLVRENWPVTSVVKCSKLWCKWQNWKFVAKSRTQVYFAQHIATTCNIEICCVTSWERGW